MKHHRSICTALGVALISVAAGAPTETNDVHKQALDVLRKAMESFEPYSKTSPPTKVRPGRGPSFTEAEQLYLQGKMSAREYQKYLEEHQVDAARFKNNDPQNRAVEVLRKEVEKTDAGQSRPGGAEASTPKLPEGASEAVPGPDESKLAELERKMDELIRLRAARTNDLATNVLSNSVTNLSNPAAPKTKRQRLDDLLKLYIAGKISEIQYREQRAKLVAGPE